MVPNPYSAFLWMTAAVMAALSVVAWRQRTLQGRRLLSALCAAAALWCFGYGAELTAQTLEQMRFWTAVQYPGIAVLGPLWLLYSIRYTRLFDVKAPAFLAAVFAVPAIALIAVWTNPWHHLYYATESVMASGGLHLHFFIPGPLYFLHLVYVWACVLLGGLALIRGIRNTSGPYATNLLLLLMAVAVPFGLAVARAFGFQPFGVMDATPFGFSVSTVLLVAVMVRWRLLGLRPLARDAVVDSIEEGLLLVNDLGYIADANKNLAPLLRQDPTEIRGHWTRVLGDRQEIARLLASGKRGRAEMTVGEGDRARTLAVECTPVFNESQELLGHALIFRDITEPRRVRLALEARDRLLKAEAEAAVKLVTSSNLDTAVQDAIRIIGEAADVDRVYIFENSIREDGEPLLSQRYEWVRQGVSIQIDNPVLQNMPYRPDYSRWYDLLSTGQPVQGLVRDFPAQERPLLEAQDIVSILVIPIHIEGRFWGFMGFDECHEERVWADGEVATLRTAAAAIGGTIARARAAAELKASERRFRSYFDLPLTGLLISSPDRKILEVNQALCDMLGYPREQLIGRDWSEFNVPNGVSAAVERYEKALKDETEPYIVDRVYRRRDGSHVYARVAVRIVRREDGIPDYVLAAVTDITELKRTEQELMDLTATLRQRVADQTFALENAVEELQRFEDTVSAELEAPLRIAETFIGELWERDKDLDDRTKEELLRCAYEAIRDLGGKLHGMRRLTDTTKGSLIRVPTELHKVAERALMIVRTHYSGRDVEVTIAPDLNAWADPRYMESLFEELFDNAFKFTGPVPHPRIQVGEEETDQGPAFYVRDNGVGFPSEMSNRLFRVFVRLHSPQEFPGRGVGLAIAHRIMTRHDGRIWAVGDLGRGATIYFTLPKEPPCDAGE